MITAFAPAKVNLTLHVTGRRADGYHLLDSLVVFADFGDQLSFAPSDGLRLDVTGPLAAGVPTDERNLVLQAAQLLNATKGAAITLDKHLPHAAGIGGGSSDAAAALRGLSQLWNVSLPDPAQILTLGADLPVCLAARPTRMQGIGEALCDLPPLPDCHLVLVNPRASVPTGPVFSGLQSKTNPAMEAPSWTGFADFVTWLTRQRNDLETPARAVAPIIDDALSALSQSGAALARMSGSGATCFGLFETQSGANHAAAAIAAQAPDWWVKPAGLYKG